MKTYSNYLIIESLPKILTMIKVLGRDPWQFAYRNHNNEIHWGAKYVWYFKQVLPGINLRQLDNMSRRLRRILGKYYI